MRQLKITKQVTNRETASLDKYLQEIGKVELITAEEEVELAKEFDVKAYPTVIAVNNNKKGAPFIELLGKTRTIVRDIIKKENKIFLSLSDEKNYALATVIISK